MRRAAGKDAEAWQESAEPEVFGRKRKKSWILLGGGDRIVSITRPMKAAIFARACISLSLTCFSLARLEVVAAIDLDRERLAYRGQRHSTTNRYEFRPF
jgi:hypothetical protein